MEGVPEALVEVTHGPLVPIEKNIGELLESQKQCIEFIDKIEPEGFDELRITMAQVPAYIQKIKKLKAEMQTCNDLMAKIQKNVDKLPK